MTGKTATLTIEGAATELTLPVHSGTLGPDVIDVQGLTSQGYFTYDPGFVSTAACESKITFIDGDEGILLHRGYPIEQLAEHSDYLETCYLLLNGELPERGGKAKVREHHNPPHHGARAAAQFFYRGFRRDAHPMAIMCGVIGALSAFYHDSLDITDRGASADHRVSPDREDADHCRHELQVLDRPAVHVPRQRARLRRELPAHDVRQSLREDYKVNPVLAKAMDRIFLLHADHEQNASTSTVRLAGSTGANPFACIAAGIAALWGPAHGGANEAVLNMLERDRR